MTRPIPVEVEQIADMKGCAAVVAMLQREHERRRPDVRWGWQMEKAA